VALSLASSLLFVTLPGYIRWLAPLDSVQVVAHRVVWSIPWCAAGGLTRQGGVLRAAGQRLLRERWLLLCFR
jgi:chloramphenicol-sensitive protein RarD